MAENPIRVAAAATGGIVEGVLLEALIKRFGYVLNVGETLGTLEFDVGEPPLVVHWVKTGLSYFLDTTDTTTPDDGLTCIVSQNGLRYHLEEGAAIKLSAVEAIVAAPAGGETNDTAYIVSVSPTGAFVGHADDIAMLTRRGWVFATPEIGCAVLNKTTGGNVQYTDAGWDAMAVDIAASGVAPQQLLFPMGLSVEAQQNAPPGSPVAGDGLYYLVGTSPSGAWSGQSNKVAYYNSSSTWAFLAAYAGALIYNKASSAQLVWSATAGVWAPPSPIAGVCNVRISVVSATPIPTTDQTAKATLYLTRKGGDTISLYVNGAWALRAVPIGGSEPSLSLSGYTSGKPYDIFAYDNTGVPAMESLVWTNDTTRATALALQDGVLVKSGDATRRYLGTIYTSATGQTEDSLANRLVYNYYNRNVRSLRRQETTSSWSYTSTTIRQANAATANRVRVMIGVAEDSVLVKIDVTYSSSNGGLVVVGLGLDSTTAFATASTAPAPGGTSSLTTTATLDEILTEGMHAINWLEQANGGTTATFTGTSGRCGMSGRVMA